MRLRESAYVWFGLFSVIAGTARTGFGQTKTGCLPQKRLGIDVKMEFALSKYFL